MSYLWVTYRTTGFTHEVIGCDDKRSSGGVIHYQIYWRRGKCRERQVQTNGRFVFVGKSYPITDDEYGDKFNEV